jgi:anti-anti-sigma factor
VLALTAVWQHATRPRGDQKKGEAFPMEIAHESAGDVTVAKLAGRLDSGSAAAAEENLTKLLGSGAPRLAIDMSSLDYISSAGLRVLLVIARKVQQAQGNLAIFGLRPSVREVFTISGFDSIFVVRDNAAAAIAAVR